LKGSQICLPDIILYLNEFLQDGELCQNLLDTLSIFVKGNNFTGNTDVLSSNIQTIYNNKNTVPVLFELLNQDDLYTKLVVMDILRNSLKVNQVGSSL
jgi:hypothetical protein